MTVELDPVEIGAAIYRVALSLDAFVVNGIQFGVLQPGDGFLEKTAGILRRDLEILEKEAVRLRGGDHSDAKTTVVSLKASCQRLTETVGKLAGFRAQPIRNVHSMASEVARLREECVGSLKKLEGVFQISKPFYQTRSVESSTAIKEFLCRLESMIVDAWNEAQTVQSVSITSTS